jgi:hypothetical protein
MELVVLLLPVVILALLDVAALRWGVDSREGSTDPRRANEPVGLSIR